MSVQFRCPCGAMLRSNESVVGKKVKCPKCGKQLQVKSSASESVPAQPSRETVNSIREPIDRQEQSFWDLPTATFPETKARPSSVLPKQSSSNLTWLWIALPVGLFTVTGIGIAAIIVNRNPTIVGAFRAAENTLPNPLHDNQPIATSSSSGGTAAAPNVASASSPVGFISGAVVPEVSKANSLALRLAEEFADHGRRGSADRAIKMITAEDFDKRLKDGPTPSWEAIVNRLETPRVMNHLRSKSLESTPLDEGFRHWRVLGETVFQNQPAVLLRYYSDPEYPHQLVGSSEKLQNVTKVMSIDDFKQAASDVVLYNAKDRDRAPPPSTPDTLGFLPPRFGYLMLILDSNKNAPKIVDIINVLGQVPMSQIAGSIYLASWQVTQIGFGSDSEYKKRYEKANSIGRKAFSIYGTIPKTPDLALGNEIVDSPGLWFRPPQNFSPNFQSNKNQSISEWVAKQEPSRTARLVNIANALDQLSSEAARFVSEFRKQHPGDPGADLAVISFAMTSLEPRMPESLLPVIDQSAESLFKTFQDPFMLYVRGLVQEAKGDEAASNKFMLQANQAGFVAMRMLRKPFERAVESANKDSAIAALKQIGVYWSKGDLDKSSNAEGRFLHLWDIAKDKANLVNADLVQRDAISGGLGRRNPGRNPESGQMGSMAPSGMQPGFSRGGGDPTAPPESSSGPFRREPGFAGPRGPGGPGPSGQPGAFPGTPPGATSGPANIRFVLQSKSAMDPNAIMAKLKEKLQVGNFYMSSSGNNATITLGFSGPFEDGVKAVDFGKVIKQDQASRTITVELP